MVKLGNLLAGIFGAVVVQINPHIGLVGCIGVYRQLNCFSHGFGGGECHGGTGGRCAAASDGLFQLFELLYNLCKSIGSIGIAVVYRGNEVVNSRDGVGNLCGDISLCGAERLNLCLHSAQGSNHGIELVAVVGQCIDGVFQCIEFIAIVRQSTNGCLDGIELLGVVGQVLDGLFEFVKLISVVGQTLYNRFDGLELLAIVGQCLDGFLQEVEFGVHVEGLRLDGSLYQSELEFERAVRVVDSVGHVLQFGLEVATHVVDGSLDFATQLFLPGGLVVDGSLQEVQLVFERERLRFHCRLDDCQFGFHSCVNRF